MNKIEKKVLNIFPVESTNKINETNELIPIRIA